MRANDFYGASGMASYEFGHTAKQETPESFLPVGTDDDQIGLPCSGRIDAALLNIARLDRSVGRELGATQLLRNALDEVMGWFFLALQLGSVSGSHFRRIRESNWLENM
jgi:hypothetical protein